MKSDCPTVWDEFEGCINALAADTTMKRRIFEQCIRTANTAEKELCAAGAHGDKHECDSAVMKRHEKARFSFLCTRNDDCGCERIPDPTE